MARDGEGRSWAFRSAGVRELNSSGLLREPFFLGAGEHGMVVRAQSAPADVRPFVPAWLTISRAEEGFARSYDEQFDEVYRSNPSGSARCGWSRGCSAR